MKTISDVLNNAQITVARMAYVDSVFEAVLRDYGCIIEMDKHSCLALGVITQKVSFEWSIFLEISVEFDRDNEPYFSVGYDENYPIKKTFYEPNQLRVFMYAIAKELSEMSAKDTE